MEGYYDGSEDYAFRAERRTKKIGATLRRFDLAEDTKRTNKGYRYTIRHLAVVDVIMRYGV